MADPGLSPPTDLRSYFSRRRARYYKQPLLNGGPSAPVETPAAGVPPTPGPEHGLIAGDEPPPSVLRPVPPTPGPEHGLIVGDEPPPPRIQRRLYETPGQPSVLLPEPPAGVRPPRPPAGPEHGIADGPFPVETLPVPVKTQDPSEQELIRRVLEAGEALCRVFPDMCEEDRIFLEPGFEPESPFQQAVTALTTLDTEYVENPEAFLQSIYNTVSAARSPNVDQFLAAQRVEDATIILQAMTGATDEEVDEFFKPNLRALLGAVFPNRVPTDVLLQAETDPESFFKVLREQGLTWETSRLLRAMGMSWDDIGRVFATTTMTHPVWGEITVLQNNMVLDAKGQEIGRMDPVTQELVPYQYRHWSIKAGRYIWHNYTAGVGDVVATSGAALRWMGWDGAGNLLSEFGGFMQAQAPPDTLGEFGWKSLYNPRWWATRPVRTVPFALALIPAAMIGGTAGAWVAGRVGLGLFATSVSRLLGAASLMRAAEAALEAGATYDEALDSGMTEVEANQAAQQVFGFNLTLVGLDAAQLAALFWKVPMPGKVWTRLISKGLLRPAIVAGRLTIAGLTEAGEEVLQGLIQNIALGDPIEWDAELQELAVLGGIFGVTLGAGGVLLTAIKDQTIAQFSADLQEVYHQAKLTIMEERGGIFEKNAAALERVAADKARIRELIGGIEMQREAVQAEMKVIEEAAPIRPPWATGLTNQEVIAVAQHEGLNPSKPGWDDSIDPEVISEARTGAFKIPGAPTVTELRNQYAAFGHELKALQEDLRQAGITPDEKIAEQGALDEVMASKEAQAILENVVKNERINAIEREVQPTSEVDQVAWDSIISTMRANVPTAPTTAKPLTNEEAALKNAAAFRDFLTPELYRGQFRGGGGGQRIIDPAGEAASLPRELAGAKPNYNIGMARYTPQFESDVDKALFIISQTKKSARDESYMGWLREQLPDLSDTQLRAAGRGVRTHIKATLSGKPEGDVAIPTSSVVREALPQVAPTARDVGEELIPGTGVTSDTILPHLSKPLKEYTDAQLERMRWTKAQGVTPRKVKITSPGLRFYEAELAKRKRTAAPTTEEADAKPPAKPPGEPPVKKATTAPEGLEVPERAGNILLSKYPEEIRPLIYEWAQRNPEAAEAARRGVRSDEEVKADARALTRDVAGDLDKFDRQWKTGAAWNAEELLAIRAVLAQKTKAVMNAQQVAREANSTENLLKLELAIKEQAAVQEAVHGLTAEAGRALRSFRQEVFEATTASDQAKMEKLLKQVGGRDRTEAIAERLSQIDTNDPIAVNKFIQEMHKPHFWDYITEIFYNSILSGPKTHIVNATSNLSSLFLSPAERAVGALTEIPLSAAQRRPRERFFGEVPADFFGAMRGTAEGFRQFAYVIKHGISLDQATKWDFRQRAFKGKTGAVINMPSRFLEASDQLFKAMNQRAALNAAAYRSASKARLKGVEHRARVAEMLSAPTETMLKEANAVAEYRLFRQPLGQFGQALTRFRESVNINGWQPIRYVIPFVRTPVNLVKFGLERTPLGLLNPTLWTNVAQKNPAAADQIARVMIGTAGIAALVLYAAQGLITGAAPRDRRERERFYREGKQPFALRVGAFWVSYQRLEPYNQAFAQAALIADAISNDDPEKDIEDLVKEVGNTFGQNFVSQTYMSGMSDLMDMLKEPERHAGRFFNRFVASIVVPMSSATRTVAQMTDPTIRDPKTVLETIMASIPGLSYRVRAKITALGEDIERTSPPWSPIKVTPVEETILSQELERMKVNIGFVGKTLGGLELDRDEQREYQRITGQEIKKDLGRLMLAPDYWIAEDTQREEMIEVVLRKARDRGRAMMREVLWTTGATADRIAKLKEATDETERRLGTVISEAPEFTGEDPDIYDMGELGRSYARIFQDIPEGALKDIELPPAVASWYSIERLDITQAKFPNEPIYQINADPKKGTTFEDYHKQWLKLQTLTGDERAEFLKGRGIRPRLGNLSKRQLELLRRYHDADKATQAEMLDEFPALSEDPRRNWLRQNPGDNAVLALWGRAPILSLEAHTAFLELQDSLDVPGAAIPRFTLPPTASIETHFAYLEAQSLHSPNSHEAQLILAKDPAYAKWRNPAWDGTDTPIEALELLVADAGLYDQEDILRETLPSVKNVDDPDYETGYQFAIEQMRDDNPEWVDNTRRVDVYRGGTDDFPATEELANLWVERGQVVDDHGGGSAEAILWLVDHPNVHQWAIDTKLLGADPRGEWNVQRLRLTVKSEPTEAQYDQLKGDDEARLAFRLGVGLTGAALKARQEWADDQSRIEAYGWDKNMEKGLVNAHVKYEQLADQVAAGEKDFSELKLYRFNNSAYETMREGRPEGKSGRLGPLMDEDALENRTLEAQVEIWKVDVKWADKDEAYGKVPEKQKDGWLARTANKLYRRGRYRRAGLSAGVSLESIDTFVKYKGLPVSGWEQERMLRDDKQYYEEVYLGVLNNQAVDFDRIPDPRYDELRHKYAAQFKALDDISEQVKALTGDEKTAERTRLQHLIVARDTTFFRAWKESEAYLTLRAGVVKQYKVDTGRDMNVDAVVAGYVEDRTVTWRGKPLGWTWGVTWLDDRVYQRHPDYYDYAVWDGMPEINFDTIPSFAFEKALNEEYATMLRFDRESGKMVTDRDARYDYRGDHSEFDLEGVRAGLWQPHQRRAATSRASIVGILQELARK